MPSLLAGLSLGAKRAPALRQCISVRGCSFAVSATFLVTAALAEAVEQEDDGQEAPNRRQRVGASQREREARIVEATREREVSLRLAARGFAAATARAGASETSRARALAESDCIARPTFLDSVTHALVCPEPGRKRESQMKQRLRGLSPRSANGCCHHQRSCRRRNWVYLAS